jgi:formamidopyrimidine-DNA glycosylase
MPELPDLEGFRQYCDATSLHQRITQTSILDQRILSHVTPQLLSRRLKDAQLQSTCRHGKFLFVSVSEGGWLVMHFGMTGELHYERAEGDLPDYARVVFCFENNHRLVYRCRRMLGQVSFTSDLDGFIEDQQLGPDALADALDKRRFREMPGERKGMLKSLLMDQSVVAGLGNVWSDEILFQAKLHPKQKSDDMTERQIDQLYNTMRRVLKKGAVQGGNVRKLPRSWLLPRREEGQSCPRCDGELRKIRAGGRSAVICPACQKLR